MIREIVFVTRTLASKKSRGDFNRAFLGLKALNGKITKTEEKNLCIC